MIEVAGPLVTSRRHYRFDGGATGSGDALTSVSALRFRERQAVEADLAAHG